MDVTYAIVKIYVTECNEFIERHSNVISASLVMPDSDPQDGFFYLPLTIMTYP